MASLGLLYNAHSFVILFVSMYSNEFWGLQLCLDFSFQKCTEIKRGKWCQITEDSEVAHGNTETDRQTGSYPHAFKSGQSS